MRRLIRGSFPPAAAASAAVFFLIAASTAAPAALKAILEVDREAYYAGDPVPVRVSIWNDGATSVQAPPGELVSGFELFDSDGKRIPLQKEASSPAAPQPSGREAEAPEPARSLGPGSFVGVARDMTVIFPRLKQAGTYRLQWSSGELMSNPVILRVVPRYDAEKEYSGRIDTDLGSISIDFLPAEAPLAVKTFIELAQTGFYDGHIFHYVEPDRVVVSGDPTGSGHGGPGFRIPHERSSAKVLAGTLIMMGTGRPQTNGSIFALLLHPRPDYEGTVTTFAQVTDGLDVARKISRAPSTSRNAPQPHRPLQDVRINRIVVTPKTPS